MEPLAAEERALPSAVPPFLEACGRLAGEAAARGDFARARELMDVFADSMRADLAKGT